MTRKRKTFRKKRTPRFRTRRENKPQIEHLQTLTSNILRILQSSNEEISIEQLAKSLALSKSAKKELAPTLSYLVEQKFIYKVGKRHYLLHKNAPLLQGVLHKHTKGFGFLTEYQLKKGQKKFNKDPFISPSNMATAQHGDTVFAHVIHVKKDGRVEAEIVSVLTRATETIGGFLQTTKSGSYLLPEDHRYPCNIQITNREEHQVDDGYAVIVKLVHQDGVSSFPLGKITEVLGDPASVDVQMRLIIERFNLPHTFSKQAQAEAKAQAQRQQEIGDRLDLRQTLHVTIDGETAKDFDDAICVTKTKKGYRLHVSIADVSHYVQPGSQLDKEAYERGTSIYFPGRVIPMLPEVLSNNICSLVPGEDRLTFTAILDFDRQGNSTAKSFSKSIITSHQRFTYTTVKEILVDKDPEVRRQYKKFLTPLKWAGELAELLGAKRTARGSIGFTLPEPFINLDKDGKIDSIVRAERNFAHQIIEECMLAANEAVAQYFTEEHQPSLYRIHEKPDREKVAEFTSFATSLDLQLPKQPQDPAWFNKVLTMTKGTPKEYVVNNLLLRTMQQARYSPGNVGHFGLAATDYTHFTSPIRRYPDLLVHRHLFDLLQRGSKSAPAAPHASNLQESGATLSTRERLAINAERAMNDRLKLQFMEHHKGESFDGVISGVTSFAFFVELLDLFVSGSVDLDDLEGDHFLHDPKRHRIVGEISAKSYQLGDIIRVTLVDVDHRMNRIQFIPAEN